MTHLKKKLTIAIDGPVGAGKSTVAKLVADGLNYRYIDTGAMYRALAWKANKEKIDFENEQDLIDLTSRTNIILEDEAVYTDGEEISLQIRTEEIGKRASQISKVGGVRKQLVKLQQKMGASGGVVAEGRDMGTVVFPGADFKFYLIAVPSERVKRRYKELEERGDSVDFAQIEQGIKKRDEEDQTREISPLRKAKDAFLIDSTNMTIEEVVAKILRIVKT